MPTHPALPWTLKSIARLERAGGIRPPRLTEPDHTRWVRLRRKMGWADFISILHADLAGAFPLPFALDRWETDPTAVLSDDEAHTLVLEAMEPDDRPPLPFLRQACRGLGLPPAGAIADLPKVQSHQRALELPGTGGRVAAWEVSTHAGLAFSDPFTFVVDSEAERLAIGLAVVELRANPPTIWTRAELKAHLARGGRFDHVFGIKGHAPAEELAAETGLEVRWTP